MNKVYDYRGIEEKPLTKLADYKYNHNDKSSHHQNVIGFIAFMIVVDAILLWMTFWLY